LTVVTGDVVDGVDVDRAVAAGGDAVGGAGHRGLDPLIAVGADIHRADAGGRGFDAVAGGAGDAETAGGHDGQVGVDTAADTGGGEAGAGREGAGVGEGDVARPLAIEAVGPAGDAGAVVVGDDDVAGGRIADRRDAVGAGRGDVDVAGVGHADAG